MKLILYRSIGEREFAKLLHKIPVLGGYDCEFEPLTTAKCNNVVCFFNEPFRWIDKKHKYFITVDIEEKDILEKGLGTYFVSKDVIKSMRWTGRKGKECLFLKEFYVSSYQISDIKEINGLNEFSSSYYQVIRDVLEENNIVTDRI